MSLGDDPALMFESASHPPAGAGTHVLLIGVGRYAYGQGAAATPVAGDLRQLSSPPISARAMADWFRREFRNPVKPLASISLLISEEGNAAARPATLANVRQAASRWAERLRSNPDNLAVFYFCGHGASLGQKAALLLEDFGKPGEEYDGAIDVDVLCATMKNSPAIQQAFFFDCCRTAADDLYQNEPGIGSRIVSAVRLQRGHNIPTQQFVLFPTVGGEEAFGVRNQASVFTSSILDAVGFAAADDTTGPWRVTTGNLLTAVDQLTRLRVPAQFAQRSKPNALDATSFTFNEIDPPALARSFVTLSDQSYWGQVEFECVDPSGSAAPHRQHSRNTVQRCCAFELAEGRWRFRGILPQTPPTVRDHDRTLRLPVAYVTLEVQG